MIQKLKLCFVQYGIFWLAASLHFSLEMTEIHVLLLEHADISLFAPENAGESSGKGHQLQ